MGRSNTSAASFTISWQPPEYSVDENGKVIGGYQPTGPNNWGRWGADDEIGTPNLIGTEQVIRAAATIRHGKVFSLGLPLDATAPRWPTRPAPQHFFLMTGADTVVGNPLYVDAPGLAWNDDVITVATQGSTQWDGLGHVMIEDCLYNGFWAGDMTAGGGARVLGVHNWRDRLVGRGVLLDIARHLGVDAVEPGFAIRAALLDEVAAQQGVEVKPGDILLFRTGYLTRWNTLETDEERMFHLSTVAGLSRDTIPWVGERDLAGVACDNVSVEVMPLEEPIERVFPFHQAAIVDLGMPLGEVWDLDALAADCADDGTYEFLLVSSVLNIPKAVGSPLNPIAIK